MKTAVLNDRIIRQFVGATLAVAHSRHIMPLAVAHSRHILLLAVAHVRHIMPLAVVLLLLSFRLSAQTVRGDFDLAAYPAVSFVWNEYNPEALDSTSFIISASSQKIATHVEPLAVADSAAERPLSILFLWEDLNHPTHAGQSAFARALLRDFLGGNGIRTGDRFNVAVFDRKGGNDTGTSIHTLLSDGFTDNTAALSHSVESFAPKYDLFSHQINSELNMAIDEGLDLLKREPADRMRVLVVLTAGSNLERYGGQGITPLAKALEMHIPVYAVKYPIAGCEHCTGIDGLCKDSYGKLIITKNESQALKQLKTCYADMSRRHYGRDYRIVFTAPFERDGAAHSLTLSISGKDYPLSFIAPSFSLMVWIKEHQLVSGLAALGILIIIACIIVLLVRRQRRIKRKRISEEAEMQRLHTEAEANRLSLEKMQREREEAERASQAAEAKAEEARLAELMRTRNMFPRLQYSVGTEQRTFTIAQPVTTIGRADDNVLVLPLTSVSRHHATISFNGTAFEIADLGSTNKVIVNGRFVERAILASGDIIGMGEAILYYYQ